MTYDLIIGVVGNLVFFCAGLGVRILTEFIRRRHIRQVFGAFRSGGATRIVLSTRPGPKPSSTERVSLNETRSFAALQQVLAQIRVATSPCGAGVSLSELSDNNLIVLGGPAANKVTEQLWSATGAGVPYHIDVGRCVLRATPKDFVPEMDVNGHFGLDFGVLIKRANPLNPDRIMIVAAGCHGFGTEGCVAMLTQAAHIAAIAHRTKGQDFAAVIQVTARERQIVSVRIAECVLLS
ncbi:MAG: hypothetical protein HZA88_20580 [Verrucomicrobia bacterium]|nr:hypothetical protein [Verrucomicrobiota bacterium]